MSKGNELDTLRRENARLIEERDKAIADNGWYLEALEYIRTIALETRKGELFAGTEHEHLLNQMSNIAQECLRAIKMNHPGKRWLEEYYKLEKQVSGMNKRSNR